MGYVVLHALPTAITVPLVGVSAVFTILFLHSNKAKRSMGRVHRANWGDRVALT